MRKKHSTKSRLFTTKSEKVFVFQSCQTLGSPMDYKPARCLCLLNSLGKNTGVGSHSFTPGDRPDPGIKSGSPPLRADSLPSEPPGKPRDDKPHRRLGIKRKLLNLINIYNNPPKS